MLMTRRHLLVGLGVSALEGSWARRARAAGRALDLGASVICSGRANPSFARKVKVGDPAPEATLTTKWIADAVGLLPTFKVLAGTFETSPVAFAAIKNGQRYIVYDQDRFNWQEGRPNWFEAGIMAHEIGHHLGGHTAIRTDDNWARELEADRFAGFALSRLGASLGNTLLASKVLNTRGTKTHPPRKLRVAAVEEGWNKAEALKKWEAPVCENAWLSEPLEVRGRTCRIALHCQPQRTKRLACKGDGDRWNWTR